MGKPMKTPKLWQKALAMYILAIAVGAYCNSIMFTHIDALHSPYGWWMKAGLIGIFDLSVFWLVTWKLFGPSPELRVYCFWATGVLLLIGLVHAGAVAQYETSKTENLTTLQAVGEIQAKIAASSTEAAIRTSGQQAQDMNARGQRNTARAIVKQGSDTAGKATDAAMKSVGEAASKSKNETFLPDWYLKGAQFWAMMACAGISLMWAFKIWGDTGLDIDGDGVADEMFAYKTDQELERIKRERTGFKPPLQPPSLTPATSYSAPATASGRSWYNRRFIPKTRPRR